MNNYDKSDDSIRWNNLYGWAMSQKLPVNVFKWVEKLSQFNERFIKSYNENSDIGYFLEVDVEYPKKLFNLQKGSTISTRKKKIRESKKTFFW